MSCTTIHDYLKSGYTTAPIIYKPINTPMETTLKEKLEDLKKAMMSAHKDSKSPSTAYDMAIVMLSRIIENDVPDESYKVIIKLNVGDVQADVIDKDKGLHKAISRATEAMLSGESSGHDVYVCQDVVKRKVLAKVERTEYGQTIRINRLS